MSKSEIHIRNPLLFILTAALIGHCYTLRGAVCICLREITLAHLCSNMEFICVLLCARAVYTFESTLTNDRDIKEQSCNVHI